MADPIALVFNTDSVTSLLGRLTLRLQGPRPLFERLAPLLQQQIEQSWRDEATPGGQDWAALARSTILEKRRLGFGDRPILERRGFDGGGKSTLDVNVADDGIRVFIDETMLYHNLGAGNLPQRRFTPEGQEFLDFQGGAAVKEFESYLNPDLRTFAGNELNRSARIIRGLLGR